MSANRSKLKTDKTQFVWLRTRQQLAKISYPTIKLAGNIINQSDDVTVLEAVFDPEITFTTHIKNSQESVSTNYANLERCDAL